MSKLLQVDHVSKSFVLHNQEGLVLPVFSNVTFAVAAGEALVLHGPSGIGKSSLLRILFGNYRADSGHVRVQHGARCVDIVTSSPRLVLEVRRRSLSLVSQFLRVIPRVTTLDIVRDPLLIRGKTAQEATRRAQEMLERVALPARLWSLAPATFSGGEQQRVNIARSFVDPTPVMLLDEPTASLDDKNRDIVVDLIAEIRQAGSAIVGIFHDTAVRERVGTRTLDLTVFKPTA